MKHWGRVCGWSGLERHSHQSTESGKDAFHSGPSSSGGFFCFFLCASDATRPSPSKRSPAVSSFFLSTIWTVSQLLLAGSREWLSEVYFKMDENKKEKRRTIRQTTQHGTAAADHRQLHQSACENKWEQAHRQVIFPVRQVRVTCCFSSSLTSFSF